MNKILFGLVLTLCAQFVFAETYWVDVRSAEEYAEGHHPEAVNIPYTAIVDKISEVTTEKDADIRLYCRSGNRAGIAKAALVNHGYTKVTNEGGIKAVLKKAKQKPSEKLKTK